MKLDVGGGRNPAPGYTPLDLIHGKGVITAAAWNTPLKDNEVTELRARHVFEHLSPDEARKTLREWMRIIAPGAVATITVPDLKYHCMQLFMSGQSEFLPEHTNFDHAINSIYGWQEHGKEMAHKWGYTAETLVTLLREHGFEVKMVPCRACDICVKARKPCNQAMT